MLELLLRTFWRLILFSALASPVAAQETFDTAQGGLIFVPAYTEILTPTGRREQLQVTLVVHNADTGEQILIRSVKYHDNTGMEVFSYSGLPAPVRPLASREFALDTSRRSGGNFIVEWEAADPVSRPAAESLMIGGGGTQGISFTSRGRTILSR